MTDVPSAGSPTPPPPGPGAQKKGLSPWAWVAIGCGALLIVALVVMVAGGMFVAKKAKDAVAGFEENPALAAAELAVRFNPELELVESDREAGKITVRLKETGEVQTFDLSDIENGRLTFGSGEETTTIAVSGEGEDAGLTVTDKEGASRLRLGAGGEEEIPAWVPRYPGASPVGQMAVQGKGETSGSYTATTGDSVPDVVERVAAQLERDGWEVTKGSYSGAGGEQSGHVNATSPDGRRTVGIFAATAEGGETQLTVSYSERTGS